MLLPKGRARRACTLQMVPHGDDSQRTLALDQAHPPRVSVTAMRSPFTLACSPSRRAQRTRSPLHPAHYSQWRVHCAWYRCSPSRIVTFPPGGLTGREWLVCARVGHGVRTLASILRPLWVVTARLASCALSLTHPEVAPGIDIEPSAGLLS